MELPDRVEDMVWVWLGLLAAALLAVGCAAGWVLGRAF